MTELSPVSHITPYDSEVSVGSIGVPLPSVEFRVVSPATGQDVSPAPGSRSLSGEMWVRSPGVMKGYLGNQTATAETITADGWLRTGDILEVGDLRFAFQIQKEAGDEGLPVRPGAESFSVRSSALNAAVVS
jgi:long-subunit acyl-CoA synthetase (AMP-forming)